MIELFDQVHTSTACEVMQFVCDDAAIVQAKDMLM